MNQSQTRILFRLRLDCQRQPLSCVAAIWCFTSNICYMSCSARWPLNPVSKFKGNRASTKPQGNWKTFKSWYSCATAGKEQLESSFFFSSLSLCHLRHFTINNHKIPQQTSYPKTISVNSEALSPNVKDSHTKSQEFLMRRYKKHWKQQLACSSKEAHNDERLLGVECK